MSRPRELFDEWFNIQYWLYAVLKRDNAKRKTKTLVSSKHYIIIVIKYN